jgi:glucosyl-dolichyl phosphate glucuronosyltransferase
MRVSVIICTRNRADSLQSTLVSIGRTTVPAGWDVELLVVDNGSTDHTCVVVNEARLSNVKLRYVSEPKPGQSRARNTGMSVAQGEIILFTDDDVSPAADWLERVVTPLLEGKYDAVVGRIESAEHLQRSWMEPMHKVWVAVPIGIGDTERELVGANMGFRRSVLERVPAFDPELGPGTLGFGDDTLFSWQLSEAGYRLGRVSDALVVHHFEPSRLLRSQWLAGALKRGHTTAYLLHHWKHGELKLPLIRYYYLSVKLFIRRVLQPPPKPDEEGCPPWEMSYLTEMELCRQFIKERRRPRNYARHGLRKNAR